MSIVAPRSNTPAPPHQIVISPLLIGISGNPDIYLQHGSGRDFQSAFEQNPITDIMLA